MTALGGNADQLVRVLVLQLRLQLPVLTHLRHQQAARAAVALLLQVRVLAVVLLLAGTLGQALPAVKLLAVQVVAVQAQVPMLVAGCSGIEMTVLRHYHTQLIRTAVHTNCGKTVIVPCATAAVNNQMLVGYEWLVEPHLQVEVQSRLRSAAFVVWEVIYELF